MKDFEIKIGQFIKRVDSERTFEIVAVRAQWSEYDGGSWTVEVDLRNVDTKEVLEYCTITGTFFKRYILVGAQS